MELQPNKLLTLSFQQIETQLTLCCRLQVNAKWDELRQVADEKRSALNLSHEVNNWHMEVQETKTWIREKAKLVESTDELGNDLAGKGSSYFLSSLLFVNEKYQNIPKVTKMVVFSQVSTQRNTILCISSLQVI